MSTERLRGLRQPDQRSCGPSTLVAARMLVDPTWSPASWSEEVLALHRQVTGLAALGRGQLPWPRALGTPPWAVAAAMADLTGVAHHTRLLRWGDRTDDHAVLAAAAAAGQPGPLYVGDRWLPRHVVLVVGAGPDDLQVYDPARGALVEVSRAAFAGGRLTTLGRWTRPWLCVVPVTAPPARPPAPRSAA